MLKRLAGAGLNFLVLGVSLLVFLGALVALNALAARSTPPKIQVLAASRDLALGEPLMAADLTVKTVYQDDSTALYIPANQAEQVAGGVAALPVAAGQPLLRSAVLAPAGEGYRLAAALSNYPDHSLFPLPLDAPNVIAPAARAILPGDLVDITVVFAARPQPPATPTATALVAFTLAAATPFPDRPWLPTATPPDPSLARTFPPLAKNLFPQGVRVVAVQGLPPEGNPADERGASQAAAYDFSQGQTLVLLVPNAARESLALALAEGDRLVVAMLVQGTGAPSAGFTYWDFEAQFSTDRQQSLTATAVP